MRRRVLIGAVAVVGAAAVSLNVWTDRGSDPARFTQDFAAVVEAQAKRTERLQDGAMRALGGDLSALTAVFEQMLAAAEDSLGDFEHLRAPRVAAPELDAVVTQARAEVRALERVVALASRRTDAELAPALGDLAEALAAREGAVQTVFQELEEADR